MILDLKFGCCSHDSIRLTLKPEKTRACSPIATTNASNNKNAVLCCTWRQLKWSGGQTQTHQ